MRISSIAIKAMALSWAVGCTGGTTANPRPLHVSTAGDDTNPGTATRPLRTIQAAIAIAGSPREIRVAGGEYVSGNASDLIVVPAGTSLTGGWSPDFRRRDWSTTTIRDATDMSLHMYSWTAALIVIGPDTVVEGFDIVGTDLGLGGDISTILVQDSPIIRNNTITCGGNSHAAYSRCINLEGGGTSPVIFANKIVLGRASGHVWGVVDFVSVAVKIDSNEFTGAWGGNSTGGETFGIQLHPTAAASITGNDLMLPSGHGITVNATAPFVVDANRMWNVASGIEVVGSAPAVRNNVVVADDLFGIRAEAPAELSNNTILANGNGIEIAFAGPTIRNNIVQHPYGSGTCIVEVDASSEPALVQNNDLFGCAAHYLDEGTTALLDVELVNSMAGASGNISVEPVLVPLDYRPGADTPLSVTTGGLDLSGLFTTDWYRDPYGHPRTVPWSMGAWEKD